ncbi:iron-containing alcohol dehydrogenase [candidate division KSB3 bacterium]|uniref:Iron-containing alcohol dehydrogenase n=1 Tax=candidate division KSB3 bacterium TaxID=2044937 RepID=A0A9D5Q776_9BACT|nr:iron-containing alcohol dehydrogenase [candidate division KSB3 bacterium]MBD3326580.1 iron-containing alcohol dehydrogenase [candidate division KSB3 bacterium]
MNVLQPFSFELPTRIEYGVDAALQIAEAVSDLNASRVLIVTDPGIRASGLLEDMLSQLGRKQIPWEIFDEVEPNPKDYNVQNGAEQARQHDIDCLVAVGGGSPIDCAKAISVVATHGGEVRTYEVRHNITGNVLPLIAVPTTAGTGSEVTFGAVITDTRQHFKFTVKHANTAPKIALVDPVLTRTMPPALTAATGMDALTHAIEAYTANVAEPLADAAALYAIELIANYLRTAFSDGQNLEARSGMLVASLLAGIAFSHSDVAAVHCIAEALGAKYDTPHGVCNAVVLPEIMAYNMEYCQERYARVALAMGRGAASMAEGARNAVAAVQQLARDVELPSFRSFGVKETDFEEIARNSAINGSNPDNPRPMSQEDYLTVLQRLSATP